MAKRQFNGGDSSPSYGDGGEDDVKIARPRGEVAHAVMECRLPPNCQTNPAQFGSYEAYEWHYNQFHSFSCLECDGVFPSSRFLDLHLMEYHDPLAAIRRSRGDPIFACLLDSCHAMMADADERRSHMIAQHEYPEEYPFSIIEFGTAPGPGWQLGDIVDHKI